MQIRNILAECLLSTSLLLAVRPALGAPADAEDAQGATKPTLWLEVVPGPLALSSDVIRVAIERELGVTTASMANDSTLGRVRVEGTSRAGVIVRYESSDGVTKIERRVALPVDPERRAQVISWVAGNLVRNEAAEILATFERKTDTAGLTSEPVAETSAPAEVPASAVAAVPHREAPPALAQSQEVKASRIRFQVRTGPAEQPKLAPTRLATAAIVSPWLSLEPSSAHHAYYLSFGMGYNHVGAIQGVGLGLLVDRLEYASQGAQINGLWLDQSDHSGVAIAGLGIRSRGGLKGAAMTGLLNLHQGSVLGAQLAGASNLGLSDGFGTQVSGLLNYQQGNFSGAQIVGGVNIAGRVSGLQIGTVNIVGSGPSSVVQLSGALNVAQDSTGAQVSVVNVARDVKGLQLGIVNVSRKNQGLSLGLFNWSEGARFQPIYFFQNPGYHNVGYRTLSGHTTGSISFGYDPAKEMARTHFSTGVRTTLGRLGLGVETGYGWVLEHLSTGATDRAHEIDLVGTVSVEVLPNAVTVFGGGGVALPVAGVVPVEPRGLGHVGIAFL